MDPVIAAPTLVTAGIALFTITNPIGTLPIFLSLTKRQTPAQQRRTAVLVGLAVIAVLLVALFAGTWILAWFGIDMTAFSIAGNLLVASIGWGMLTAKANPVSATPGESPVVVPLAIPVLAGPGAIALVITYAHGYTDWIEYLEGSAIIVAVGVLTAAIYAAGPWVAKVLRDTGMSIVSRVFGLLLLAIAIQAIILALLTAFPVLAGGPAPAATPSP